MHRSNRPTQSLFLCLSCGYQVNADFNAAPNVGVVVLPQQRWSEAAARWRAVEEMGFAHAWTYDHLAWQSLADRQITPGS